MSRIGYADPPYPGCAHKYRDHPDFAGEVDHVELLQRLDRDYDGWVLHTSSTTLEQILHTTAEYGIGPFRIMAWVKPFAAFKRNVSVAYAWEPILVKCVRKPVVTKEIVMRDWREVEAEGYCDVFDDDEPGPLDWIAESITLKKGLTGAKPPKVCEWLFHVLGAEPGDELVDLYPGTGIVGETWAAWSGRELVEAVPQRSLLQLR